MHLCVRNAAEALSAGLRLVLDHGVERGSRNGPVVALDEPVTVTYERPSERVIHAPQRDANPFFHLYECLWMLQGRNDVAGVAQLLPTMRNFSDDGKTFNAAYGHRWRRLFGHDQIDWVVAQLRRGATEAMADRRLYVSMHYPRRDQRPTLDVPCNVGVAFRVRSDERLDMTVFNRSNDLVLGLAGANVVHMSFLHELISRATGIALGRYHQVTNDLHLYLEATSTAAVLPLAGSWSASSDPYATGSVEAYPVMQDGVDWETWDQDLHTFQQYGNVVGLRDRFFRRVAAPMMAAHRWYREHKGAERYVGAVDILDQCIATDWAAAGREWMQRRLSKYEEKVK